MSSAEVLRTAEQIARAAGAELMRHFDRLDADAVSTSTRLDALRLDAWGHFDADPSAGLDIDRVGAEESFSFHCRSGK